MSSKFSKQAGGRAAGAGERLKQCGAARQGCAARFSAEPHRTPAADG
ncbi:hypothetical protein [Streptomyces fuscichromogenes]|nr:hypothetical protein [Streptomyces fuscichromogenes]